MSVRAHLLGTKEDIPRSARFALRRPALFLCVVSLAILLPGWTASAQNEGGKQRTVITKEDLVKLTAEGISDELIVGLIRAADELPSLTPDDVIALRKAGVSVNVLTAITQRKTATVGERPQVTGQEPTRRIRVTASLQGQQRSVFRRLQEKDEIDQTQVTWVFKAHGWRDRTNLVLPATPNCPKDPVCVKREGSECVESIAPDSAQWQGDYGCHVANKLTKFGKEYEIFHVDLPEPIADAEVHAYFRSAEGETMHWFTRNSIESTGKRVPGFVKFQTWGATDFNIDVHVELIMSPGGYVQDLRVSQCNVVNRDDTALERRIMSADRQYCSVQEARL